LTLSKKKAKAGDTGDVITGSGDAKTLDTGHLPQEE